MSAKSKNMNVIEWLAEHWPKSTIFLSVFSFFFFSLYLYEDDFLLYLLWLQASVYWLHQFEEYVYPGGFARFFNRQLLGSDQNDWPVTKIFSLWINVPIIFIAFPLSAALSGIYGYGFGIWMAYFSILNALSHVVMFFRFGYNPGFIVSLLLNIPLGIFTVYTYMMRDAISPTAHVVGLIIAILIQGGLMIWGLGVLRSRVKES